MELLIYYAPAIIFGVIAAALVWYFFVKRFVDIVLFALGYRRFSAYHDEKRGMNEHVRFVRRNFKRAQKLKRTYYFRLLTDKDGEIEIEERDGKRYFRFLCLNTGEEKQMSENWLIEALYFGIVSNAELKKGAVELVADRYTDEVPEYNKKVGDVSFFNMTIGTYNDDPIVQMDVESINAKFYDGYK